MIRLNNGIKVWTETYQLRLVRFLGIRETRIRIETAMTWQMYRMIHGDN